VLKHRSQRARAIGVIATLWPTGPQYQNILQYNFHKKKLYSILTQDATSFLGSFNTIILMVRSQGRQNTEWHHSNETSGSDASSALWCFTNSSHYDNISFLINPVPFSHLGFLRANTNTIFSTQGVASVVCYYVSYAQFFSNCSQDQLVPNDSEIF
jgi:hypothetical protein